MLKVLFIAGFSFIVSQTCEVPPPSQPPKAIQKPEGLTKKGINLAIQVAPSVIKYNQ